MGCTMVDAGAVVVAMMVLMVVRLARVVDVGCVGGGCGNRTAVLVQVVLGGAVCYVDVDVDAAAKNGGDCVAQFKRMWADNGAVWW